MRLTYCVSNSCHLCVIDHVCLVSGFFLTFLCYIWYCVKLKLCVCSRNHACVLVSHVCVIGVLCSVYRILTQSFIAYGVLCCMLGF